MSRLADDVVARLRGDIVDGTYEPGARLTESLLCTSYGVSRVPVREALKQLEVEGFVVSRAYAGVSVAHMGGEDAEDLFAVRRTIESITTRRAAARCRDDAGDEDVQAFADRLEQLVTRGCSLLEAGQHAELPPLNTAFHLGVAEFSGSGLLPLLRQVSAKIQWLYAMDVDVRGRHSWDEHRAIAAAVTAGRTKEAARLMARHIDNSEEGYLLRHAVQV